MTKPSTSESSDDGGVTPQSTHRLRATAGVALVALAALLVPVSILGLWTRNQLLDTDRYVQTVTPLATDPAVQSSVTDRVTEALYDSVDVKSRVAEALPERGAFLAAPISLGIENLIHQIVDRIVHSDQFAKLWVEANRVAHSKLVDVLENSSDRKGAVAVDLSGIEQTAASKLSDLGIDIFPKGSEGKPAEITVFQSDQLAQVQSAVKLFDTCATVLPWFTIALLVAAVFVFANHRRGVAAAFGGLLAGALLTIAAFAIGRWFYLGALPTGSSTATATNVFDTLTRFVRGSTRVVAAVGFVGLVATLLAGPSRPAVALRGGVSKALGRAGDEAADHGVALGAFGAFVAEYVVAIRVAIVAVVVLVLVIQDQPSAGTVLWAAGLTLLALAVLQVLARIGAAGASGDADADSSSETTGSTAS